MFTRSRTLQAIQNIGLTDRIVRGVLAALILGLPSLALSYSGSFSWHGYVILLGIYPALTAILGWDPFYDLFHVRSCGGSRRSQCGTFPYEVNAALGHAAGVKEFDHTMSAVHLKDPAWRAGTRSTRNRDRALATVTAVFNVLVIVYLFWLYG